MVSFGAAFKGRFRGVRRSLVHSENEKGQQ